MLNLIKGFSPRYAPPEVFARLHLRYATHTVEDDMMADCYSIGALVWEIVSRQVRALHQLSGGGRACTELTGHGMPRRGLDARAQIPWDMHSNEEIEQNLRFGMRLPEIVRGAGFVAVGVGAPRANRRIGLARWSALPCVCRRWTRTTRSCRS